MEYSPIEDYNILEWLYGPRGPSHRSINTSNHFCFIQKLLKVKINFENKVNKKINSKETRKGLRFLQFV